MDNATPSSQISDDRSIAQAVGSEPQTNGEHVAFEGADRGDSKWYFSVKKTTSQPIKTPLRIVSAGYGALDASQLPSGRSDEDDQDTKNNEQSPGEPKSWDQSESKADWDYQKAFEGQENEALDELMGMIGEYTDYF